MIYERPSKKRDWRTKRRFDHEESPADDEIVIACVSVTDGFRGILVIHRSRRWCVGVRGVVRTARRTGAPRRPALH